MTTTLVRPPAPTGADRPAGTTANDDTASRGLGLTGATALVIGSIIGTGIFTVPAALAGFGTIGILAFVIVTVGAMLLAVMYSSLARRVPAAGGPYAYARLAFGDFAGFTNAWSYWLTCWAGNAAIVTGWVLYVAALFGWDSGNNALLFAAALVGLWLPALVNLLGVRQMDWFQVVTTVAKFLPLAFVAVVGLFFMQAGNFGAFNTSGTNWFDAISTAGVVVLFSFLGIETASVAAGKVRNPERNVPRATLIGTMASGLVYVLCTVAIFGVVGPAALQASQDVGAPFIDTFVAILGSSWSGQLVALVAVISGIGALNGWTMICAEMPYAAAQDGLFPKAFGWTNRRDVPWFGIVSAAVLATVFTGMSYLNEAGLSVFLTLVYLTGVTASIPYFFSALAQLYLLFTDPALVSKARLVIDSAVAVLAGLFSLWFVYGSGADATYWAFLMILAGFAVYAVMKIRERRSADRTADRAPAVVDVTR